MAVSAGATADAPAAGVAAARPRAASKNARAAVRAALSVRGAASDVCGVGVGLIVVKNRTQIGLTSPQTDDARLNGRLTQLSDQVRSIGLVQRAGMLGQDLTAASDHIGLGNARDAELHAGPAVAVDHR